jgi:hypothetical protein
MGTWTLAEFASSHALLDAARALRAQGVTGLDAHSPYPLPRAEEALGLRRSPLPAIALVGGLVGAGGAYAVQWYSNAVDYPLIVGGRPASWPPFIPIVFELGVLCAALSLFFGALLLMGLPRPHHPLFEIESFRSATRDGLWLSVAPGPTAPQDEALRVLGAVQVFRVEEPAR